MIRRPYVSARVQEPRAVVRLADPDVSAALALAPDGEVLLGLDGRGQPFTVPWESDCPHVGVCMAAGMGETVLVRSLAMQHLRRGGEVLVLEPQQRPPSQSWCRGVAGVRLACGPQEIADAMGWLDGEVDRRCGVVADSADPEPDPAQVGPRLLVVAGSVERLELEAGVRTSLVKVTMLGRLTRVHAVLGMRTPRCLGHARENLSTWVLSRVTHQVWSEVGAQPVKSSCRRGLVHVVSSGSTTPVQLIYVDEDEALRYAAGGASA